jgi:hypothetical protein
MPTFGKIAGKIFIAGTGGFIFSNGLARETRLARALHCYWHEQPAISPDAPQTPRRLSMTNSFNNSFVRNLVGMVAAVLIGGTFLVAAAGPAVAATNAVNSTAISNIVRSA